VGKPREVTSTSTSIFRTPKPKVAAQITRASIEFKNIENEQEGQKLFAFGGE